MKVDEGELVDVESSVVAAIGYDESSRDMTVKFVSGSVYVYSNVPPEVHNEVLTASSVGRAFWELIRRRGDLYPFEKIS